MAATTPELRAQNLTYEVQDTMQAMPVGGLATFNTNIVNSTKQKLTFSVVRTVNDLPSDWQSWICTNTCFDSSVSTPPTVTIDAGGTLTCELSILAGMATGTAHVSLQFGQVGSLFNSRQQVFTASVAPAGVGQERTVSALRLPYPNPATNLLMIPIGAEHRSAASASLKLYDPNGNLVGDFTDEARSAAMSGQDVMAVDVSAYPSGSYLYQLAIDGKATTSSFAIAR
jgi:hypothetical protein